MKVSRTRERIHNTLTHEEFGLLDRKNPAHVTLSKMLAATATVYAAEYLAQQAGKELDSRKQEALITAAVELEEDATVWQPDPKLGGVLEPVER